MIETITYLSSVDVFTNKKPNQVSESSFLEKLTRDSKDGVVRDDRGIPPESNCLSACLTEEQSTPDSDKAQGQVQPSGEELLPRYVETENNFHIKQIDEDLLKDVELKAVLVELRWFATGLMSYLSKKHSVDFSHIDMEMEFGAGRQACEIYFEIRQIDSFSQEFSKCSRGQSLVHGIVRHENGSAATSSIRESEQLTRTYPHAQFSEYVKRKFSKVQTDEGVEIYLRDYLSSQGVIRNLLSGLKVPGQNVVKLIFNGRNFEGNFNRS